MKTATVERGAPTDAEAKQATGRTMKQWYALLDEKGALQAGRREATNMLQSEGLKDEWWLVTIAVEYETARGVVEKDGRPRGYGICVTKTIDAPVKAVYAAWTDAAAVGRWFGKVKRFECKDGGRFEAADGDCGDFKRVRADKDLRFTWENPGRAPMSLVDVAFAAKGGDKTGITLNHARIQSRRDADELRAAWGEALSALKEMLES